MLSNFLFNNIDIIKKQYTKKIENIQNPSKKTLKNRKETIEFKKNIINKNIINIFNNESNSIKINKELNSVKIVQEFINKLDHSYKDSTYLLEIIKKQIEKNILIKYDIEKYTLEKNNLEEYDIKKCNKNISNNDKINEQINMKKKFLIIPSNIFLVE